MNAMWLKLVNAWKSHKNRFVGVLFCSVLVLGVGFAVTPVLGQNTPTTPPPATAPAPTPPPATAPTTANTAPAPTTPQAPVVSASDEGAYDMFLRMVSYLAEVIAQAMTTILVLFIGALLAIISYDAFSASTVIDVGWPIVRDAINMFVVLALLAVAIMNLIPGKSDNARTQQQLVTMLIAVVLMNFSRTIALLAIDFSQVVTMTFAEAVSNIAAGNFIQLFGIQNNLVVNANAGDVPSGAQMGGIFFATASFKILLLGLAIISIIAMVIAFMVRILVLWVLIVVAPAAFFAYGIKDIFPMNVSIGEKPRAIYSFWSEQFTGMLIFGPVLMFFLWLSLTIVTGGDVASMEEFKVQDSGQGQLLTESASPASLLNTIVGIGMLMAGLMTAAKVAGSNNGVSQIMGKASEVGKSFLKKGGKVAVGLTAFGATGGALAGASAAGGASAAAVKKAGYGLAAVAGVGALGYGGYKGVQHTESLARGAKTVTTSVDDGLASLQNSGVGRLVDKVGIISGARAVAGRGTRAIESIGAERRRAADKAFKEKDENAQLNDANMSMDVITSPLSSANTVAGGRAAMQKLVTDKGFEKAYRKKFGDDRADEMISQMIEQVNEAGGGFWDHIEDSKDKKSAKEDFFKFKVRNIDKVKGAGAKEAIIRDEDFRPEMLTEQGLEDDEVWNALGGVKEIKTRNDGTTYEESYQDKVEKGVGKTKSLQKFVKGGRIRAEKYVDKDGGLINESEIDDSKMERLLVSGKVRLGALSDKVVKDYSESLVDHIEENIESISLAEISSADAKKTLVAALQNKRENTPGLKSADEAKLMQGQFELGHVESVVNAQGGFDTPEASMAIDQSLKKDIGNLGLLSSVVKDGQDTEIGTHVGEHLLSTYKEPGELQSDIQGSYKKKGAANTYRMAKVMHSALMNRIGEEQAKDAASQDKKTLETLSKLEKVARASLFSRTT